MNPPSLPVGSDFQVVGWLIWNFGLPFALVIIFIVGLMRKWWVMGWTYEAEVLRSKETKTQLDYMLGISERQQQLLPPPSPRRHHHREDE